MILALLLVLSISSAAMASATGASLRVSGASHDGVVTVGVYLTAEGITNGRVEVTYDAEVSELSEVIPGDARWVVSVNSETEGKVSMAWVGSSFPAEEDCLVTLKFKVKSYVFPIKTTTYTANICELFAAPDQENVSTASLTASVDVDVVSGGGQGGGQVTPLPTPPETPSVPEGEDDPVVEPEIQCPFTDIDNHWGKDYIVAAWEAGLVNGTTETTYSPNKPLTRGMFATLLYRLAGSPEVEIENPFTDVAGNMYYADPIVWAYSTGIVKGVTATEFRPNSNITRQELVTMLHRYAKFTGNYVKSSVNLDDFSDAADVAGWAREAMEWAVAEGVIVGSKNQLSPKVNTNRAETATILVRYAGL